MTKTTPKRNRAQTVAVIREHLISPRWAVKDYGSCYVVEPKILAVPVPVDKITEPVEMDRLYRFDKRDADALERARFTRDCLRADALADTLSELGK